MLILPRVEELPDLNKYPVFYWNHVGLEMNRITHSLGGPHGGPTMSSRALGLLQLAMHDAFFIALGHDESSDPPTYLRNVKALIGQSETYAHSASPVVVHPPQDAELALKNANRALTGAAMTMLDLLYAGDHPNISIVASSTLTRSLTGMINGYPHVEVLHPAHVLGVTVARQIHAMLAVKPGEIGADAGHYRPKDGAYFFRDEPVTPVRRGLVDPNDPSRGDFANRVYHGPFYGFTVADFAVHEPAQHRIADWPKPNKGAHAPEYLEALREVSRIGGAPHLRSTERTPAQTVTAYFWAYDGANLIGTPPRLYNQIIRQILWKQTNAKATDLERSKEFVRVLALANTAMADAGKYAWREKYRFELWRPLSGIREHVDAKGASDADPFWLALGAPETNTNHVSFKPPFPAYPSGHATFGAAAFQMLRLYYAKRAAGPDLDKFIRDHVKPNGYQHADTLSFELVSDELNGISRDLREPYDPAKPIDDQLGTVRTLVRKTFASLWEAIFDNAFSRIYLGVHWNFDAASAANIYGKDGKL